MWTHLTATSLLGSFQEYLILVSITYLGVQIRKVVTEFQAVQRDQKRIHMHLN